LSREILKPGWPWVPIELIDEFFRHVHSFCLGAAIQRVWSVDERDDAPKVTIPAFETLEGESRRDAKRRLRASYIVAMATLDARPPAGPRGRVPRRKIDEIKRNARWFYRSRVLGESILSIARAYHA